MFLIMKILILIIFILFILFNLFKKLENFKKKNNFLKTIECGFNNFNFKHLPLMNNFILILIIFMIFDLEFFLFIPLIMLYKLINWLKLYFLIFFLFLFIYFSMMYEIKFNSILWMK